MRVPARVRGDRAEGGVELVPAMDPGGSELARAGGAREEAAVVGQRLDLDEEGPLDAEADELHSSCTPGIATTKRPPQSRIAAICPAISARRFHGRMRT